MPEWKSKARRLILDVVTLLFILRHAGSDAVNITITDLDGSPIWHEQPGHEPLEMDA